MEGEEEGGIRLSKRFDDNNGIKSSTGEVDYKTKSGTAWSHNFLNQKPWHPLSYPNQRRKWIAEQTNANHQRRADEVAREFAQEQEFFRQTALVSKKEKEKIEMMKAVSFMYVRPPGYDPESAKAAEMAEERRNQGDPTHDQSSEGPSTAINSEPKDNPVEVKKKSRPKDVFGRSLPTGEEFEILKNAPKMETGIAGRPKPFAVEIRNVKCLRCGTFGHQSGDRECVLKDTITPNEESRLIRDDPLTAIMAHTEAAEPLKWELKQRPGISPPRGGFNLDDPNQQIVAEDIFDEYGGFLNDELIPELLALPKMKKSPRKSKSKKRSPKGNGSSSSDDDDGKRRPKRREKKYKNKKQKRPTSYDNNFEADQPLSKNNQKRFSTKYNDSEASQPHGKEKLKHSLPKYFDSDSDEPKDDRSQSHRKGKNKHPNSSTFESPDSSESRRKNKQKRSSTKYSESYEDDSETDESHRKSKRKHSRASGSKYDSEDRNRSRHRHEKNPDSEDRDRSRHHHRENPDPRDHYYRSGYHHEHNHHNQKNPDAEDQYRRHQYQDNDHDQNNPDHEDHCRNRDHRQDNDHDQKNPYAEGRYSNRHHRDNGNHRHDSRHNHQRHDK